LLPRTEKEIAIEVQIAMPTQRDGAAVWRLIREQRSLDLNAGYAYLLLCSRFATTCRMARLAQGNVPANDDPPGELAGALIGLLLPEQPDTYFVWQIAVHERFRGQGLARALIDDVLRDYAAAGVRYLEAHVSPDNRASQAMFRRLARSLHASVELRPDFEPAHYPTEHGPEHLLRIGPFNIGTLRTAHRPTNRH
jgi:L-2,4-diaminobutyric acid acetyltransferase